MPPGLNIPGLFCFCNPPYPEAMAKHDPTGYADALATIPKGQLSERQQRIATGGDVDLEPKRIRCGEDLCLQRRT